MAMNHVRQVHRHKPSMKNSRLSIDHMGEDYLHSIFYQVLTEYQVCIEQAYLRVKIGNAKSAFGKMLCCSTLFCNTFARLYPNSICNVHRLFDQFSF